MQSSMTLVGSSSTQKVGPLRLGPHTGLPLVPCPKCGEENLELICGEASKVPGAIFFKCSLHDRDDPRTCPWFLFADKYEKMVIRMGLMQKRGIADTSIRQEDSLAKVQQVSIGRIEGAMEANKTELTPLLADVVSMTNGSEGVAEKLQKLVDIGKVVAICLVVIAVVLVVGVITTFFK